MVNKPAHSEVKCRKEIVLALVAVALVVLERVWFPGFPRVSVRHRGHFLSLGCPNASLTRLPRGRSPQVASGGGLLLAYSAGSYLDWENLAGLCALPPLLLIYLSSYVLESPYWLLRRGRQREAGIAANRLYGFQIPDEIRRLCIDGSLRMISGGPRGWHAR